MSGVEIRSTLIAMLRRADRRELPQGWLYLADAAPSPSTEVLFISDEADVPDTEQYAAAAGFPHEGLETEDLVSVVEWMRRLTHKPSDEQLVRSFSYYLRFDAFLPALDAPNPPSREEVIANLDREFYQSLGPERDGTRCRREGCRRGTVQFSVFCGPHHFESVKGRPWIGDA